MRSRGAAVATPEPQRSKDDFSDLRGAFDARLQSERTQFVALSAALANGPDGSGRILEELVFRAHKLRGAAEIFQAFEVSASANALEQAAVAASTSAADPAQTQVRAALARMLVALQR